MTSNGGGDAPITNGHVHENNAGAVQVMSCDRCKELEKELEKRKREHTFYTALKKKITLTDTLIKKYNNKCQEFDQQKKKLEDVTFRLASSRKDCKVLEEHLSLTLKEVIPWKRGKDKFLKELEECQAKLKDTQEELEGSEASCVQFKEGFFAIQEKLETTEDKQSDLKKAVEKSKHAEKKMLALNAKVKDDLTDCKRVLKNTRNREARITGKYKRAKNKIAELVGLLNNHGVPVSKMSSSLLRGSASGQEGTSPEDTDLDLPEDAFSPPEDITPSPVKQERPQKNLKLTKQKDKAPATKDMHLKRIFERFARDMPVSVSALSPSPYPAPMKQDIGIMSDTSSDVSRDDGSNDEAFSDVADQIESQLNLSVEENPSKERSLKESPLKESLLKESPLKESLLKESPLKESPLKESPLKESPLKESPLKESPLKESLLKESPLKESLLKESPLKESPLKESPLKESPLKESPLKESPLKESPLKESPLKESPLKESPLKESPLKESPLKESPLKESPLKESPLKESPLKESPSKESPSKESPSKESPLKESPLKESPLKESPLKESPLKESPLKESPLKESPLKESPSKESLSKESPSKESPLKESLLKKSPLKESPLKESPLKESPLKESPLKESPLKESPSKESPSKENPPKESLPKENPPKESPKKAEDERMQLRQTPQRKAKAQKLEEVKDLHDDSDLESSPESGFSRRRIKLRAKRARSAVLTPNRKSCVAVESLSDSESEPGSPLNEALLKDSTEKSHLNETKSPRKTCQLENTSNSEISKSFDDNGIKEEKSVSGERKPQFSETTVSSPEKSSVSKDKTSCDVEPPSTEMRENGELQESWNIEDTNVAKDRLMLSPDRRLTRSQLKTLIEQGGTSDTSDFHNSMEKALDREEVRNKSVSDVADEYAKQQLKQEEIFSPPRRPVTRSVSQSDGSSSQEITPTSPRATPKRFLRSNSSPGERDYCERPTHEFSSDAPSEERQKSPTLPSPKKLLKSESLLDQSSGLDTGEVQADNTPSKPDAANSEKMSPRKLLRSVSAPANKPGADSDLEKSAKGFDSGSTRRMTRSQTLIFASPNRYDAFRRVTRSLAHNLSLNLDVEILPQKTSIVTSRKSRKRLSRSPNRTKEVKKEPKMMTPGTPNEELTFASASKKDALSDSQTADEKPDLENLNHPTVSLSCGTSEGRAFSDNWENSAEGHLDERKPSIHAVKFKNTSEMELASGQDGDSANNPLMQGSPKTERNSCEGQSIPGTCEVETLPDHPNARNDGDVEVSADAQLDVPIKVETVIDLSSQNAALDLVENYPLEEPTNKIQADLKLEEFEEPVLDQLENEQDTKMQQEDSPQVFTDLLESPTGCKIDNKAEETNIKSEEQKINTLSSEESFSSVADCPSYVLLDEDECNYGEQDSSSSMANKEARPFDLCKDRSVTDKENSNSVVFHSAENTNHTENVGDHLSDASSYVGMAAYKIDNNRDEVVEPQVPVSDRVSNSTLTENPQQHQLKPCDLEVVQFIDNQETDIKTVQHVTCMEAESSRASTPTTDNTRSVFSVAGHVSPVSPLSLQHSQPVSPLSSPTRTPPISPLSSIFGSLINIPRMVSPLPQPPEALNFESVDEIRHPASLEVLAGSALTSQPRMISPLFPTPVPPAVSPLLEASMPNALSPLSDTSPRPSLLDQSPRNPLIPSPCNFHSEAPRDALSVRPQHSTPSGKQPASRCLTSSFTTTNATAIPNPNIISPRLRSLATEMASEFGESQPSTSKVKEQQSQNTAASVKTKETEPGRLSTDSSFLTKKEDGKKAGQHLFKLGLVNASKKSPRTPNAPWQTAFVQQLRTTRHSRITEGSDTENKETRGKSHQQVSVSETTSEVNQKDRLASVEARHKNKQDSCQNSAQEIQMPRVAGKRKQNEITEASSEDDVLILEDKTPRRSTRSLAQDGAMSPQDFRHFDSNAEMTSVQDQSGVERDSEPTSETPRKRRKSRHTSQTEVSVEVARPKPNQQLGTGDGGIPTSEEQGASNLRSPPNQSKRPGQCVLIPNLGIKTLGFKKPGSGMRRHATNLKAEELALSQESIPLVEEEKMTAANEKPKLDQSLIRSSHIDASEKKVTLDSNVGDGKKPLKCKENLETIKMSPQQARLSHTSTVELTNKTRLTKTPLKLDALALKQPTLTLHPVSISNNQQITPLIQFKPQNGEDKSVSKPSKSKSNIGNIWGDIASRKEPGIAIFNRGNQGKKKNNDSGDSDNSQSQGTLTEADGVFPYNSESLKRLDNHKDQTSLLTSGNDTINPCHKTPKLPASALHAGSKQVLTTSPDNFSATTSPPPTRTSSQAQGFPSAHHVGPKPELLSLTLPTFRSETSLNCASEGNRSLTEQRTKQERKLTAVRSQPPPCITSQSHVTASGSETLPNRTSKTKFPQFNLSKQSSTPKCTINATPINKLQGTAASESLVKNLCTDEMRPRGKMASGPTVPSLSKTNSESRKRLASQQDDVNVKFSPRKQPKMMTELPHTSGSEVISVSKVKSSVQVQQPTFSNIQKRLRELRSHTNVKPLIGAILTYLGDKAINLMPAIQAKCFAKNTSTKPLLLPSEEQIVACILDSTLPPKKSSMSMLLMIVCRGARMPPDTLTKTKPAIIASASYCRFFAALSRHLGFLERVRVFCYDLLHEDFPNAEELLLNIAVTWPDALMNKEGRWSPLCTAIEVVTMQRLVQAASPQNLQAQEIIQCFGVICQWRIPGGNVPTVQCHRLVTSMQDTDITRLQSTGTPTKSLTPESYEIVKAVELLAYHQGWQWTNDHLVRDQLWPVLKKWSQEVQAANAAASTTDPTSATSDPTSATSDPTSATSNTTSATTAGAGSSCVESPADASACAVMKVIGGVATIGLSSNKQSVFELLKMLAAVLQQPSACVPWTVQVFTAEAILALSPSNPTFALEVMQRWRRKAVVTIPRKLEDKVTVLTKVANHINTASR